MQNNEEVDEVDVPEDETQELSDNVASAPAPSVDVDFVVDSVSDPPSTSTVPYADALHAPEPSIATEHEADSESSELDTPKPRRTARNHVPRSFFSYNELGNPTILRM